MNQICLFFFYIFKFPEFSLIFSRFSNSLIFPVREFIFQNSLIFPVRGHPAISLLRWGVGVGGGVTFLVVFGVT
jgi:hypothetical protein